jgi:hypothetical protein
LPTKNIHHRVTESDKDSPQRHGEHREEEEEEEERRSSGFFLPRDDLVESFRNVGFSEMPSYAVLSALA